MSLGLVIPVWNDQIALTRLLENIRQLDLFDQVVVVDDGSDVPVSLPRIDGPEVRLMRKPQSGGPGPARNAGLAEIATEHVIFFDSDDLMTRDMVHLWTEVQSKDFDFCIFRHCDSRGIRHGHWGLTPYDAALWRAAGMGGQALRPVTGQESAALARTANFPWNKIWRTAFLRDHRISCSDIRVHEDIAPHWMGFLEGGTILASDRVAAVHHVTQGADRLTNAVGRERLAVFGPLAEVLQRLGSAPANKAALLPAFLRFACDLLDWIHGNLDPRWWRELAAGRRAFWRDGLPPALFDRLVRSDPALALHLTLQMAGDRKKC